MHSLFRSLILISALALAAFTTGVRAEFNDLSDYRMDTGDLINIQVYGEPDLSVKARITDAGTIAYPFLGEVKVKDRTIGELSTELHRQLSDGYLVSPNINVVIEEFRQFYIYGEVKEPGGYPYQPGLTLQKAVALASGFTVRASDHKFYLTRAGVWDELERNRSRDSGKMVKLNQQILPGDIIKIEHKTFF